MPEWSAIDTGKARPAQSVHQRAPILPDEETPLRGSSARGVTEREPNRKRLARLPEDQAGIAGLNRERRDVFLVEEVAGEHVDFPTAAEAVAEARVSDAEAVGRLELRPGGIAV